MDGDDLREAERLGPAPPVPEPGRARAALRLATIDVGPLRRHRDFRLLFVGMGVSTFGSMITYVALPYQVYQLTGSSLAVGLMSLAELGPLLVTAFVGGALADSFDRRRLVQVAELLLAVCAGILALNASLGEPRVWVLFVVGAAMAGLDGIQRPPLDALIPRLVDREELTAASALDSFRANLGWVAGPAVAGVLIAVLGLPVTYLIDVATFAVSLLALGLMRAVPPPPGADRPSLRGIVDGFRYATSRPELVGTYSVDLIAMFFGMPMALIPAFAEEFGGAGALGLLYAAPSVGALIATATSGWTGRVHRHGLAVVWAAAGWGVAITALGFAPNLALALAALALAGGADMISGIFRTTIWNTTIPDHLRGRLAGIEQVSYSAGPLLGNLESGVVAAFAGVRASIVSGGVLCVAGVAVAALALPALRRYDAREQPAATPAEPARS
ncbi:MAG TPA: MFS transporter [Gaiellaceae bacterium]|nr:MFS transporter [Gaiellaceae bacterium]